MTYTIELFRTDDQSMPVQESTAYDHEGLAFNGLFVENDDILDVNEVVAEYIAKGEGRQEFQTSSPAYFLRITQNQ
ncbi:hypothetical protein NRE35_004368 [Salmonella enterica]|nr:hypothetical protein [Salmonella enterica]